MSMQQEVTCESNGRLNRPIARGAAVDEMTPPKFTPALEPKHLWYLPLKTVADCVMALLIMIPALPTICIAALIIKLTSRGPIFYVQTRVGKAGRPFPLIKLRTMVHNAEMLTGPVWSLEDDDRVTAVGRFLRNTHIDEFPQLCNILLGQMSLIGPRPERPEFLSQLEGELPHYRIRLSMKPGITGLAQLRLAPDADLESVRRKLHQDLYYGRYVSPWLDFQIAISTGMYFVKALWCGACSMFQLPRLQLVERQVDAILNEET